MSAPLVSVILVCRNPGPRVRDALASVEAQADAAREVVVIDGASTDGTREWLDSRRARVGALVSAPDRGIYDAMNKGCAAACGDWVLFLGADDRLAGPNVLAVAAALLRRTAAGVVVGEAVYDDGRAYRPGAGRAAIRRNFVHHQAAFYRRELWSAHGGFDASLRIMGDYDFNLRLLRAGVRFEPLELRVAHCGAGGLSDAGSWTGYREEIRVRHRHFPPWRCWPWDLASVARCLRKKLVHRPTHG